MPSNKSKRFYTEEEQEQLIRPVACSGADSAGYITEELPSRTGIIQIRGIEGKEENLFTRDNRKDPLKPFFTLIQLVTQGLPVDPLSKTNEPDWRKVLTEDWMFILFLARRLTYGDIFRFDVDCPNCTHKFPWEEDLATTEIFYARDSVVQQLQNGGTFSYTLPIGTREKVVYRMPVAHDQKMLYQKRLSDKEKLRTESLRICVESIDGKQPSPKKLEGMRGSELRLIEQNLDQNNFGINISLEVECPKCGYQIDDELPLDSKDFLLRPEVVIKADGTLSALWDFPVTHKNLMNSISTSPLSETGTASI